MKITYVLFFLSVLNSCAHRETLKGLKESIKLIDGRGNLEIMLPIEFDTSYVKSPSSGKIIFSNKNYYILSDDGPVMEIQQEDSLFNLTISQRLENDHLVDDKQGYSELLKQIIEMRMIENPYDQFDIAEVRTINKRDFVITANDTDRFGKQITSLVAITYFEGNKIQFTFNCFANNCEGFIEQMETSLNSVEITAD